jgi:hypothetical protein
MLLLCASLILGVALQAPSPSNAAPEASTQAPALAERPKGDFELPPLPPGKVSLVGGAVERVDSVHDVLLIRAFGGRDLKIAFDTRTSVVQDNRQVRISTLQPGTPVSIDTMSNGPMLFAKTIRVNSGAAGLELRGQVVSYNAARNTLRVRNEMSMTTTKVTVSPKTPITSSGSARSTLREGELVHIKLSTMGHGDLKAQTIDILAEPGHTYTFDGVLTALDLRTRTASIASPGDAATYEVALDRLDQQSAQNLREGDTIRVDAEFDGKRYNARSVQVLSGDK